MGVEAKISEQTFFFNPEIAHYKLNLLLAGMLVVVAVSGKFKLNKIF